MAAKHSCQVEIEVKKCSLTVQTVKKWVMENDKILQLVHVHVHVHGQGSVPAN